MAEVPNGSNKYVQLLDEGTICYRPSPLFLRMLTSIDFSDEALMRTLYIAPSVLSICVGNAGRMRILKRYRVNVEHLKAISA